MMTLAAVTVGAFTGYKTLEKKTSTSDLLLTENIEALSSEESTGNRVFHSCKRKISAAEWHGRKYTDRYCGDCKDHEMTMAWEDANCYE